MITVLLVGSIVGGCAGSSLPELPKASDLNPFKKAEKKLPGKRVAIMPARSGVGAELAPADAPIALASAQANTDWSQPGGTPANAPGHLVYSGNASVAWRRDVGTGSTSRARLTASPVVYGNRIFVLDSQSVVSAVSIGGQQSWRVQLVPENENAGEGFGGGLAVDEGRLIVATGFGSVVALTVDGGRKLWEQNLKVPVRASPTAANGQVFVVASDGRLFNLNLADGSVLWSYRGLPQSTGLIANPSPAVSGSVVATPYPSGELVALSAQDGLPVWSETLASTRMSGLGAMSDVARPVIANGNVYAISHSGRMVATRLSDGERLWSANVGSLHPPAISGNHLFVADTRGKLAAFDAESGQAHWTVNLPGGGKWAGPALGSGRLWLASNKGALVGVDAATGRVVTSKTIGSPVYIAPIIAGGRMYVLTNDAELIAFN